MRPWSSAAAVAVVVSVACATPRPSTAPVAQAPRPAPSHSAPEPSPPTPTASTSSPKFDTTIKPILVASCTPCHFPGGKMYDRLPFDDPDVVSSHSEGVLRRIKDPAKRDPIEAWLKSTDSSTPR